MLIVVSGLPGVGKSAVATSVAARLAAVHLSIDPVEDALLRCDLPAGWNLGVAAYEAVRTMAESNLALGRVVVVDAVNDSAAARDTWRHAADATNVSVSFVVLTCSDTDEHRRRLEGRDRGFVRLREPSWSAVRDRARDYARWDCDCLVVDTCATSVTDVCDLVCAHIAPGATDG